MSGQLCRLNDTLSNMQERICASSGQANAHAHAHAHHSYSCSHASTVLTNTMQLFEPPFSLAGSNSTSAKRVNRASPAVK